MTPNKQIGDKHDQHYFGIVDRFIYQERRYEVRTCEDECVEDLSKKLYDFFIKYNDIWNLYNPSYEEMKGILNHRVKWSIASCLSLKLIDVQTQEIIYYNLNVDQNDYRQMIESGKQIHTPEFFKLYGVTFSCGNNNQIHQNYERGYCVWGTYFFAVTDKKIKGLSKKYFKQNLEYFYRIGYYQCFCRITSDKMKRVVDFIGFQTLARSDQQFIHYEKKQQLTQSYHFMVCYLEDSKNEQKNIEKNYLFRPRL